MRVYCLDFVRTGFRAKQSICQNVADIDLFYLSFLFQQRTNKSQEKEWPTCVSLAPTQINPRNEKAAHIKVSFTRV